MLGRLIKMNLALNPWWGAHTCRGHKTYGKCFSLWPISKRDGYTQKMVWCNEKGTIFAAGWNEAASINWPVTCSPDSFPILASTCLMCHFQSSNVQLLYLKMGIIITNHKVIVHLIKITKYDREQACLVRYKIIKQLFPPLFPLTLYENLSKSHIFATFVQLLSHVWLFVTLQTAAYRASQSSTVYWSLLKLVSTKSVMPFIHLILCLPLLVLPSIFPSIMVFSSE